MSLYPEQWLRKMRQVLIGRLRPGHDTEELLGILSRAEAIRSDVQRSMLEQLLEFQDTRIREVMVSRSEIHALPGNASLAEAEKALINHGVNRMPVIEGDLDHVLGIVHLRDVIAARIQNEQPALTSMLRPCLRASELEQLAGLLEEMKEKSCHLAIVHDEYGGTAGLVTLSDLMREIVGEINESGEEEEAECRTLDDGSYEVLARMHIDEFCEATGARVKEGDYDTVAGWITTRLGRIPGSNESVRIDKHMIHILRADPRRISKVRIQVKKP